MNEWIWHASSIGEWGDSEIKGKINTVSAFPIYATWHMNGWWGRSQQGSPAQAPVGFVSTVKLPDSFQEGSLAITSPFLSQHKQKGAGDESKLASTKLFSGIVQSMPAPFCLSMQGCLHSHQNVFKHSKLHVRPHLLPSRAVGDTEKGKGSICLLISRYS